MQAWEERAGEAIRRLKGIPVPYMAEIGVGYCNMARALLASHPTLRLIMVDSFLPANEQPEQYRATGDNFAKRSAADAERDLSKAKALANQHRDRATLLHMDSRAAVAGVKDGALDLVFIDADHSYEGVKRDIAAWLPKVRPGGWLGGHDYRNSGNQFDFSGVDRAVAELESAMSLKAEPGANFTWWVQIP